MTDPLDFEARLEERLRARAALASRPFDAAAIARQAVAVGGRRRTISRLEWPSTATGFRWLVVVLLALAFLGVVAAIGALLLDRPPLPASIVTNGWIVVSANPAAIGNGEFGDIYLVGAGGAARRIIGADDDGIAQACPRFSPDGHRIAYGEARASEVVDNAHDDWPVRDRAVVVVGLNAAGEASEPLVRVAVDQSPGPIPCPEWSPDGRYVAFRSQDKLWTADTVSGRTTEFPAGADRRGVPGMARKLSSDFDGFAWSRDGSRIAVPDHDGHIRIVNVGDGSSSLIPVEVESRSVVWLAEDARIAYLATEGVGDGVAVHVVDPDGTNDIQISPEAAPDTRFADLVVSPDGRRVAFIQKTYSCGADGCRGDPQRLLIAEPDRGSVTDLPVPTGFAISLQWSPDGERMLFMTNGEVGSEVLSIGLEPGSPVVVHSSKELNLEWSDSELTWQPVIR